MIFVDLVYARAAVSSILFSRVFFWREAVTERLETLFVTASRHVENQLPQDIPPFQQQYLLFSQNLHWSYRVYCLYFCC